MTEPTEDEVIEASQHFLMENEATLGLHSTFVLGEILSRAYRSSQDRVKELEDAILTHCANVCSGLGKYSGKLRHEPNCLAYDLDLKSKEE